MKLQSSPKIFENYKSDIPENTIKNIEEGFERLGLKLEYIPGKSITGLDVFNGRCVIKNTPIQSFGKGITPVLAKASAYAEIAERVSSGSFFYHLINLTKRKDLSYNIELKGEVFSRCKDYKFLDGYSYEKITEKVRNVMPEEFVPLNPLQHEYKDILLKSNISKYNWVNGYSLSRNKKVRIPIKFLSAISGTNGQAAGNTFEEAITQGLCEVFERY
jgi:ribosomal protein S12 methylthiotransferase accessory factor